jgi:hypothetical protein
VGTKQGLGLVEVRDIQSAKPVRPVCAKRRYETFIRSDERRPRGAESTMTPGGIPDCGHAVAAAIREDRLVLPEMHTHQRETGWQIFRYVQCENNYRNEWN